MVVTTKHLLNFLPIDDSVRKETLAKLNSYTPDQKLTLERTCWMMFYELLNANVKYEFGKTLLDIGDGKRKPDNELYKKIEDQVYARFMRDIEEGQEVETIETLREDLKGMFSKKVQNTVSSSKPN